MWCVYRHTAPSKKVYIGISKNIKNRWCGKGRKYLKIDKKTGKYVHFLFAKAMLKYGWDNITHEILYDNLTEKEAKLKEKELIAHYNSLNLSYNVADSSCDVSYINNNIPIVQLSHSLEIIREWKSAAEAAEQLNFIGTNITQAIKKKANSNGFYWIYKSELPELDKIVFKQPRSQKVYQLDPKSKTILNVFNSIKDAAETFNVVEDAIGNAISRKYKSCVFYWIKELDLKKIKNIQWRVGKKDPRIGNTVIIENIQTGEQLSFESQMAMCRYLGYSTQTVYKKTPNNMRGWKVIN